MTLQPLSDERIPERERRLLAWIAYHLTMSGYVEIAVVSRRFLTADVHMTPEEGEAVLDALAERGIVRIEYALSDEHRIALRLVGRGSVGPAAS